MKRYAKNLPCCSGCFKSRTESGLRAPFGLSVSLRLTRHIIFQIFIATDFTHQCRNTSQEQLKSKRALPQEYRLLRKPWLGLRYTAPYMYSWSQEKHTFMYYTKKPHIFELVKYELVKWQIDFQDSRSLSSVPGFQVTETAAPNLDYRFLPLMMNSRLLSKHCPYECSRGRWQQDGHLLFVHFVNRNLPMPTMVRDVDNPHRTTCSNNGCKRYVKICVLARFAIMIHSGKFPFT